MSKNLVKGVRALIQRQLMLPFIGISILSIIYGMFLPETFSMWMGLNLYSRIIISVLLIAPLGIMMGMPLPIGMTLLDFKENKLVLWAWGLNGVASVIGSILCIVIAHLMGYKVTFFLSAVCYLAAILCLMRLRYRYQKCEI
jgi:O-antigen/teichoic acid export membrane protein